MVVAGLLCSIWKDVLEGVPWDRPLFLSSTVEYSPLPPAFVGHTSQGFAVAVVGPTTLERG